MAPAFSSTGRAAAFGGLLVIVLTLPWTLHRIGRTSREEFYRGISERAGAFDYIRRQIFETHSDLDVAFCGNSLLRLGIDPALVEREFSRALGRPASTLLLPQSWQGPDMNYFVARDLLEHRRVKLLVLAAPAWSHRSNQPHVQLFRLLRYGDHPGALDHLDLRHRLAIYAGMTLGAPRQALTLLRPNLIDADAGAQLEYPAPLGYMGQPFHARRGEPASLAAESMIYSAATSDLFRFNGPALNSYQLFFIRRTIELARRHATAVVILHMPSPSERGLSVVSDRALMPQLFGNETAFAGVPSTRLFQNVPASEFEDYYQDEHLNRNGMDLFTRTITPALIRLYEQHVPAR